MGMEYIGLAGAFFLLLLVNEGVIVCVYIMERGRSVGLGAIMGMPIPALWDEKSGKQFREKLGS